MDLGDVFLGSLMGSGLGILAGAAIIVVALMLLALYVYNALVLRTIAVKTKVGPKWLAWIPVVGYVLLLKAIKLDWKWIFAIFVGIVPFIGSTLLMAAGVYVWWRVCEVRKMQPWIAILMLVPVANLVAMGYIAWGKK